MSHTALRVVLWPRCFISFSSPRWEDPRFRHVINLPWLTWRVMGRVSVQLRSDRNWSCSSLTLPWNKNEEWFWSLILEGRKWKGKGRFVLSCLAGEGTANLLNWRSHFFWPEPCWKHQEISRKNQIWILSWEMRYANSERAQSSSISCVFPMGCTLQLTSSRHSLLTSPGAPHLGAFPVWAYRYLILWPSVCLSFNLMWLNLNHMDCEMFCLNYKCIFLLFPLPPPYWVLNFLALGAVA